MDTRQLILTWLSLAFLVLSLACSDNNENETYQCFSFDERQCAVDSFADPSLRGFSEAEKTVHISDYLSSQDIEIEDAKTNNNFHKDVCEACTVCPEIYRFFIKVEEEEAEKIRNLGLLNLEEFDCADF